MEIELALREIFRNIWFYPKWESYHRSRSIVIVETVENDGEEKRCWQCGEAILLPPFFECDSRVFFHMSCLKVEEIHDRTKDFRQKVDRYLQTLISHCDPAHELIFEEELQNFGNKEAVCFACDEPVVGPACKCSAPNCDLLFHKSCAHSSRKTQHPLYDPNDTLVMHLGTGYYSKTTGEMSYHFCLVCGKRCYNCLYYRGSKGEFILDVACSNRWQINTTYDCLQHVFVPIRVNFTFTCQACGTENKDLALICTTCRLFIGTKCSRFSRAIIISHHEHSLLLILPLRQLKNSHYLPCNICARKVSTDYAAYCCQVCNFVAHLHCTNWFWVRDETVESSSKESVALLTNDVEEMTLEEIHQHKLILSDKQLTDDELCDVCMRVISTPPFYSCSMQCNFFLHATCARLPKKKRHPLHQHTLTLFSVAPTKGGIFQCDVCNNECHGFNYRCGKCGFNLDAHCCSIPQTITHPSHQHPLFLAIISDKHCSACNKSSYFLCIDCDYSLCYACATLPLKARHKYDEHLLALTYATEDKFGEYYCLLCEGKRNATNWFYYCQECDFSTHVECVLGRFPYIKIGSTYKDFWHEHPVTLVRRRVESSPLCGACHKPFHGLAVECTQCKFNVHWWSDNNNNYCLHKISAHSSEEEEESSNEEEEKGT